MRTKWLCFYPEQCFFLLGDPTFWNRRNSSWRLRKMEIYEWLQLHPHKKSYPLHKRFSVIGIGEFSAPQEERNKESWYLCTFTDEIQPKLHVLGFGNWYYKECLLVPRLFHLNLMNDSTALVPIHQVFWNGASCPLFFFMGFEKMGK